VLTPLLLLPRLVSLGALVLPGQAQVQDLVLPDALPARFQVQVEAAGGRWTLDLVRHSLRAPGFEVRVQEADGKIRSVPPPPVSTYQGTVLEISGSSVAANLSGAGLRAALFLPGETPWYVQPLSDLEPGAPGGRHLAYPQPADPFQGETCGNDLVAGPWNGSLASPLPGAAVPSPRRNAAVCNQRAEIAFDADVEFFQIHNGSVAETVADVEGGMNAVEVIYARDVLITYEITQILVRTAEPDPYFGTDAGAVLTQFQTEWNTNQAAVPRDTAHLLTGKGVFDGGIIGLAFVGVVCNLPAAYGLSQFSDVFATRVGVVAHELGHNWNAPHCLDPPCVVMCGACPRFGPITAGVIFKFRDSIGCLDPDGPFATPVPPRARDDSFVLEGTGRLDVLANDYDGNCDFLTVSGCDSVSKHGGKVVVMPAKGPGGRDLLRYEPAAGFSGSDTFQYVAGDGNGGEDSAQVTLEVFDDRLDLVARYRLDETAGSVAADSSRFSPHEGRYLGDPARHLPPAASATKWSLGFDGVDDLIEVPGWKLPALDELTLALWLRIDSSVTDFQVVASKIDPAQSGLDPWALQVNPPDLPFPNTPGFRWVWWIHGGSINPFQVQFEAPLDQFVHVAVTEKKVAGSGSRTVRAFRDGALVAENTNAEAFTDSSDSPLRFGSAEGTLFFRGGLDDVQLYDQALTAKKIQFLTANPGSSVPGNLVARYPLDEAAGVVVRDRAGSGLYDGSPTLGRPGAAPGTGTSVQFDGLDDRMTVSGALLAPLRDLSLSFWIRIPAGNSLAVVPLSKGDASLPPNTPWSLVLQATSPGDPPGTRILNWNVGTKSSTIELQAAVPTGRFVHVVVTHDQGAGPAGGTARIYLDGVLAAENTAARGFADSTASDLFLGGRADAFFFRGLLDDLQIYDRAITAEEAAFLHRFPGSVVERKHRPLPAY